ncbi:MAG: hypothetical protein R2795_06685 [Saprospiraceae bacterium]
MFVGKIDASCFEVGEQRTFTVSVPSGVTVVWTLTNNSLGTFSFVGSNVGNTVTIVANGAGTAKLNVSAFGTNYACASCFDICANRPQPPTPGGGCPDPFLTVVVEFPETIIPQLIGSPFGSTNTWVIDCICNYGTNTSNGPNGTTMEYSLINDPCNINPGVLHQLCVTIDYSTSADPAFQDCPEETLCYVFSF